MKREVVSQRKYVVEAVGELIRHRREHPGKEAPLLPSVAFAIEEAVKQAMRELAQQSTPISNWDDLLRKAIDLSMQEMEDWISQKGEHFNFEPYLDDARESLASVAKEIQRLQQNLLESRAAKRVYDKEIPVDSDETIETPFEVAPIGLLDSIDGYLAAPRSPSCEMNLDALLERFQVEGDWFPYEINLDGMVFVVDDDGTLFVSTENYPEEVRERAQATLMRLAFLLYG
ncbi:MAG: hypothetical protein ACKO38_17985 [Planctomycetota bacterium]